MNNPPKKFQKRSSEQGDQKWQQDEQEHGFELVDDVSGARQSVWVQG